MSKADISLQSGNITLDLSFADESHVIYGEKKELYIDVNHDYPFLLSTFGSLDYRDPMVLITDENGYASRRFLVKKVEDEENDCKGLPLSFGHNRSVSITYIDDLNEIEIKQFIKTFDESAFSFSLKITNIGKKALFIKRAYSMEYGLEGKGYDIYSFPGHWGRERNIQKTNLETGEFINQSTCGISSSFANPLIVVGKGSSFYGFNILYSGNHKESVSVSYVGNTKVMIGMNDFLLDWKLSPSESFFTPEVIMTKGNNIDEIQQRLSSFVRKHIMKKRDIRPIVYNTWEGSGYDIGEAKWKNLAKLASEIGCEVFLFDDGWFLNRNSDSTSLGDFVLDEAKIGEDFEHINEYLNSLDLKLGLWIEPEMVSPVSLLAKSHPEFILRRKEVEPIQSRNQLLLDLANHKCVEYVKNMIVSLIEKSKCSYIKWDFNRLLTDIESESCRGGEYFHRFILGYYEIISSIRDMYPDLYIEGCASGGARFDLGTLRYVDCIWTSDNTSPRSRLLIQEGTSIGYPLCSISNHYSASPNVTTHEEYPCKTRAEVAFFGVYGVEVDLSKISLEETEYIAKTISFYKKHRQMIGDGTFHIVGDPMNRVSRCWLLQKDDESLLLTSNEDSHKTIPYRLPYFDAKAKYILEYWDGRTVDIKGSDLINGLALPNGKGLKTQMVYIRRIKE